jgi:hypothetical protein
METDQNPDINDPQKELGQSNWHQFSSFITRNALLFASLVIVLIMGILALVLGADPLLVLKIVTGSIAVILFGHRLKITFTP